MVNPVYPVYVTGLEGVPLLLSTMACADVATSRLAQALVQCSDWFLKNRYLL